MSATPPIVVIDTVIHAASDDGTIGQKLVIEPESLNLNIAPSKVKFLTLFYQHIFANPTCATVALNIRNNLPTHLKLKNYEGIFVGLKGLQFAAILGGNFVWNSIPSVLMDKKLKRKLRTNTTPYLSRNAQTMKSILFATVSLGLIIVISANGDAPGNCYTNGSIVHPSSNDAGYASYCKVTYHRHNLILIGKSGYGRPQGTCNCIGSLASCTQLLSSCQYPFQPPRELSFTPPIPSVLYVGQYYSFSVNMTALSSM